MLRSCRTYSSEEEKRGKFSDDGFLLALRPVCFLGLHLFEEVEELGEFSKLRDERMMTRELLILQFLVIFIK